MRLTLLHLAWDQTCKMEFVSLFNLFFLSLIICLSTWIYFLSKRKHSYWSEKGVSGPKPRFLFGNFLERLFRDTTELNLEWTRKYGGLFGFYQAYKRGLMVTDPELIKQVTVKDFHHFVDRFDLPMYHEMWNQNLFLSQGEQWRRIRTIVSPTFTSGKLRGMHRLMLEGVHKLEQHLDRLIGTVGGVMETKKVFYSFSIDVIASTVFALETNANSDREEDRHFVQNGKRIFNLPIVKLIPMIVLPKFVLETLGIDNPVDPKPFYFFTKITQHILAERKNQKQTKNQNDYVQLLLDASVEENALDKVNYEHLTATADESGKVENDDSEMKNLTKNSTKPKNKLTDSEIIANMILFFTAGFESTSSALSYCIYALAQNPEVQEHLYQELIKVLGDKSDDDDHSSEEKFVAKVLTEIPYLEAVIKETLRLYTTVNELYRICQTDGYQLGSVKLSKNDAIHIPVAAIHLNPDYYPEPRAFKPERFLPENKHLLIPYTYLPFGTGPRNCLGMRFAYQEVKLCIAKLVTKYRFSVTAKTPPKLTYQKGQPLRIACPFELRVEKR